LSEEQKETAEILRSAQDDSRAFGDDSPASRDAGRASRDDSEGVTVLTSLAPVLQLLPYQRRWVEDDSHLKIVVKARQIGYSFAASIRALLECLKRKTTWIFLSKGERQSRLLMEKVQEHIKSCGILARACESSFFEGTLIKQLEVRFANGSVIYGLPANPDTARGYSGNVTLDEFAFHADADKIYTALFPTITRGYCLEVISTPNGQQGKFYELAKAAGLVESGDREIGRSCEQSKLEIRDEFRLSNFDSSVHPIIGSPDHPIIGSPDHPITRSSDRLMWSGHRVDIYEALRQGLKIDLQLLRAGCDDETSWQQEYCCQFVSTAENFIPPALVAQCVSAEAAADCPPQFLASASRLILESGSSLAGAHGPVTPTTGSDPALVGSQVHAPLPADFYLGIDIGRRHDRTVFWIDEVQVSVAGSQVSGSRHQAVSAEGLVPDTRNLTPGTCRLAVARMVRTFSNTPFAEQLAFARELLSMRRVVGAVREPPLQGDFLIRRACIDSTGMGAPLAESLQQEFGPRVEPVTFTAAVKEDMAYRVRRRMEQRLDLIPDAPQIARAFGAVKKLVTLAGNTRFDAERTDLGHADEFWAKALADLAAEQPVASSLSDGAIVGTPRAAVWMPAPLPAEF
jgi:phage FluMu gp28-like protein